MIQTLLLYMEGEKFAWIDVAIPYCTWRRKVCVDRCSYIVPWVDEKFILEDKRLA